MKTKIKETNWSEELKALRAALSVSQEALSRLLGVSMRSVQLWEAEAYQPGYVSMSKIMKLKQEVFGEGGIKKK